MSHALAETITQSPTESGDALAIRADALRAEAWAGEPFLRPDENPTVALAPGTARRRALDDALPEIEAGLQEPSSAWKVRFALLLGPPGGGDDAKGQRNDRTFDMEIKKAVDL